MYVRCAKMLVTGLMLFLLASPAQSQVFSLWGDEGMTTCEIHTAPAPYQPFNVFVFLDPDPEVVFGFEYKLKIPSGHFSTGQVINPVVRDATIGVWFGSPGISASLTTYEHDLFWIVNLTMMASNTTPGYYEIEPNEDSDFLGVGFVGGGSPLKDASVYNHFGFNSSCVIGTEESSWGAIKELYR